MKIALFVLDAVRRDHLGPYGGPEHLTPTINALADRGLVFEDCYSAAPWTPASHATMFTGRYPSHHDVRGNDLHFGDDNEYFTEVLSDAGITTEGFAAGAWLTRHYGFDRLFDRFLDPQETSNTEYLRTKGGLRALWKYGRNQALSRVTGVPSVGSGRFATGCLFSEWTSDADSFSFCNIKVAHARYGPPPYFRELADAPLSIDDEFVEDQPFRRYMGGEITPSLDQWSSVRRLYAAGVSHADFLLGKAIESLDDDTWIIVTADHGEHLGEFRRAGHMLSLHDNLVRVPLVIAHSSLEPGSRDALVSHVDLTPTIYALAEENGFDVNPKRRDQLPGQDLLRPDGIPEDRVVFSEYGPPAVAMNTLLNRCVDSDDARLIEQFFKWIRAAISTEYKYVEYGDGEHRLFKRPGTRIDVSTTHPAEVDRLREAMREALGDLTEISSDDLDAYTEDAVEEQLRDLGYL